jgi:poly-gamma-glutamate capsule biosynthesis protein CapA/YwtB (metallophosphatase superfamily)
MRGDLIAAMKARDDLAVVALRSAIAAIDDAEAIDVDRTASRDANSEHIAGASAGVGSTEVPRRVLSDADEHAVVRAQAEERSTRRRSTRSSDAEMSLSDSGARQTCCLPICRRPIGRLALNWRSSVPTLDE